MIYIYIHISVVYIISPHHCVGFQSFAGNPPLLPPPPSPPTVLLPPSSLILPLCVSIIFINFLVSTLGTAAIGEPPYAGTPQLDAGTPRLFRVAGAALGA